MEYSEEERDEFKRVFEILDTEGEGYVGVKDLDIIMRRLGKSTTEKHLQAMINEMDMDGNGIIEFDEFLVGMSIRMSYEPDEDDLRDTFRIFDKGNSGYISMNELRLVMLDLDQQVSDEECEEMIQNHDADGDGKLSYEEFVQMMTSK